MTQSTSTIEQTFTVRGKDRMSDEWTTFTGSADACLDWADRRAFVVRDQHGWPVLSEVTK